VFSADVDTAMDVARRLQTGVCHINDATINDEPQMPLGGVKASGWGAVSAACRLRLGCADCAGGGAGTRDSRP
jgi:acyl-CoA reductase-like NAD-dependent aldehyde dehydrogenase